jgi:TatD DNase family protein
MLYYDVHTHLTSNHPSAVSILNVIPGQAVPESFFSAGIHPWYAKDAYIEDLHKHITNPYCVAIGECGLDNLKSDIDFAEQKKIFYSQLELAKQFSKPVILHVVRSNNELFHILKDFPELAYIWHGFTGNIETVNQFSRFNMFFSFGNRALKNENLWRTLLDDLIVCETDDSSSDITDIYSSLALIRNIDLESLALIIKNNIVKIFGNELERKN